MNPVTSKKAHERFFLDRFLNHLDISPTLIEERERPDFLVHIDGRVVGIEVTYLHIRDVSEKPLRQAVESVTDRIVAAAQRLYKASGAPPAHVTVLFSSWLQTKGIRRNLIAEQLADLVKTMHLQTWQRSDWRSDREENDDHPLSPTIDTIHALGVPEHSMAHWTVARAGWVAQLTPARLQDRIDEKALRVDAYKAAAQETWLLIVADGMKPSQAFSIPPDFLPHQVSSPFARTYFFGYPQEIAVELGV